MNNLIFAQIRWNEESFVWSESFINTKSKQECSD